MDNLSRQIALIGSICSLCIASCTSMVQATYRDPAFGDREITAIGRTGVAIKSREEGAVDVKILDRNLVVERTRLVVDGVGVAPIGLDVRRIHIVEKGGNLSVDVDDQPLWAE